MPKAMRPHVSPAWWSDWCVRVCLCACVSQMSQWSGVEAAAIELSRKRTRGNAALGITGGAAPPHVRSHCHSPHRVLCTVRACMCVCARVCACYNVRPLPHCV